MDWIFIIYLSLYVEQLASWIMFYIRSRCISEKKSIFHNYISIFKQLIISKADLRSKNPHHDAAGVVSTGAQTSSIPQSSQAVLHACASPFPHCSSAASHIRAWKATSMSLALLLIYRTCIAPPTCGFPYSLVPVELLKCMILVEHAVR